MDWKGNLEVAEKMKENLIREGWPVCGAAVPSGKRYSSMVALWEERLRQPQVLCACFIFYFIFYLREEEHCCGSATVHHHRHPYCCCLVLVVGLIVYSLLTETLYSQLVDNEDSLNYVNWYIRGANYWESCNSEVYDMLGGQVR